MSAVAQCADDGRNALLEAFADARRRRARLAALPFSRRLLASPRQTAITLERAALERLPGAVMRTTARTFWGERMTVVLPEAVSSEILRFGYVEANLVAAMLEHAPAGGVVFDVGAHFGFFSLLAKRLVGPEGRVFAFEPAPSTAAILRGNVEPAGVTVVAAAVWKEPCEIEINDLGAALSAFNSVRRPRLDGRAERVARESKVATPAVTLDGFASEVGERPGFVKVDAESAEFEVLLGMETLLREAKPVVCLELGDLGVEGAHPSRALVDHMIARGYRALEHSEDGFREHAPLERYPFTNLLFVPA